MDGAAQMVWLCIRGIKAQVECVQRGKLHLSASVADPGQRSNFRGFYCIQFLKCVGGGKKKSPFNHSETATMPVSLQQQAKALLH